MKMSESANVLGQLYNITGTAAKASRTSADLSSRQGTPSGGQGGNSLVPRYTKHEWRQGVAELMKVSTSHGRY